VSRFGGALGLLLCLCACGAEAEPTPDVETPLLAGQVAVLRTVEIARDGEALSLTARAGEARVDADGDGLAEAVEARVEAADQRPPLEVASETAQWDLSAQTVRFEGSVVATRGTLELRCNVLEVRYRDPEHLENAVATGDVRVVDGERRASGSQAELTVYTGELVLTGNPVIEEGANTMRGDRIVLFLDDDRLVCTGCRLVVQGEALRAGQTERGAE